MQNSKDVIENWGFGPALSYRASKVALNVLTKTSAIVFSGRKAAVSCVAPFQPWVVSHPFSLLCVALLSALQI